MFFKILMQTVYDAAPMLLAIASAYALIELVVLIGSTTRVRGRFLQPRHNRGLSWDLTGETRYLNPKE